VATDLASSRRTSNACHNISHDPTSRSPSAISGECQSSSAAVFLASYMRSESSRCLIRPSIRNLSNGRPRTPTFLYCRATSDSSIPQCTLTRYKRFQGAHGTCQSTISLRPPHTTAPTSPRCLPRARRREAHPTTMTPRTQGHYARSRQRRPPHYL
jgi:hypothetical protein